MPTTWRSAWERLEGHEDMGWVHLTGCSLHFLGHVERWCKDVWTLDSYIAPVSSNKALSMSILCRLIEIDFELSNASNATNFIDMLKIVASKCWHFAAIAVVACMPFNWAATSSQLFRPSNFQSQLYFPLSIMSAAPSKRGVLVAGLATAAVAPLFVAPSTGVSSAPRAQHAAATAAAPSGGSGVGPVSAMALTMLGASAVAGARRKGKNQVVCQASTETFQQQPMEYPAAFEEIADVNNKEKKAETWQHKLVALSLSFWCVSSELPSYVFILFEPWQHVAEDIICTIGPKSWDPEVLVKLMKVRRLGGFGWWWLRGVGLTLVLGATKKRCNTHPVRLAWTWSAATCPMVTMRSRVWSWPTWRRCDGLGAFNSLWQVTK